MKISSSAFAHNGPIPTKYTCEGDDVSPSLEWSAVPPGAKSLALIVDVPDAPDPAAPKMTWVHWLLYDLPPEVNGLLEAVKTLPPGTREALNDWAVRATAVRARHWDGTAISSSYMRSTWSCRIFISRASRRSRRPCGATC